MINRLDTRAKQNSTYIGVFLHKSFLYLIYFISLLVYQDYNQLFIHINLVKLCSKLLFLLTVVFAGSNISCLVLSVVSFWYCLFSGISYFISWCGCRFCRWFCFRYPDWCRGRYCLPVVFFGTGR